MAEHIQDCGCKVVTPELVPFGDPDDIHLSFCPLHKAAKKLQEALEAWDALRTMHPLDSSDDIMSIFLECCEITDNALAEVDKHQKAEARREK